MDEFRSFFFLGPVSSDTGFSEEALLGPRDSPQPVLFSPTLLKVSTPFLPPGQSYFPGVWARRPSDFIPYPHGWPDQPIRVLTVTTLYPLAYSLSNPVVIALKLSHRQPRTKGFFYFSRIFLDLGLTAHLL